ncbi:MAG: Lrp/AsnC family transcriptional regulator [Candidatus Bathyarchaeia archaeon]
MDETDLAILRILQEDASISFIEIARRLRISESTVRKRVEKMRREGVIKRFTVVIDPPKIGFNAVAMIGIDVDPSKVLEVVQKLCELPETKSVATSMGDHMIMAEVWAKNTMELLKILNEKIAVIDGVKRVCPAIILEKIKE